MVEIVAGWNELALVRIALNLLVGCLLNEKVSHFAALVSGVALVLSLPVFGGYVLPFIACNRHLIWRTSS